MGRQSQFEPAKGDEICEHIANGGSLRSYCEMDGNPTFNTVYRWIEGDEAFAEAYARARQIQAHADADKITQVSEALERGEMQPDVGRVIIGGMQWTAARRLPRVYGDKVQLSNDTNAPLVITWANGDKV